MSVVETVLVFAGIPIGVLLVVGVATMAPSAVRGQNRYRPGRPWTYDAAWWLPEPSAVGARPAALEAEHRSVVNEIAAQATEDADRRGVGADEAAAIGRRVAADRTQAAVGGASGEW